MEEPKSINMRVPEPSGLLGVRRWISRHELVAFFVLAFVISASIWGAAGLLGFKDPVIISMAGTIGSYGPSLAALVILSITSRALPLGKPLRQLRGLLFLVGVSVGVLVYLRNFLRIGATMPLQPVYFLLGGVASLLAGWMLSNAFSNRRRVAEWMRSLFDTRVGWTWYLVTLFLWPALVLAGSVLGQLLHMPVEPAPFQGNYMEFLPQLGVAVVITLFFGGPLGEEPGWRGFALPRLQQRFNPLIAGLVLGVLWSLWHAPLHLNGFYPGGLAGLWARFLFNVPMGILFTWLYNRTHGSLLIAVLFHTAINVSGGFLATSTAMYIPGIALLIGLIVLDRMWVPIADRGAGVVYPARS